MIDFFVPFAIGFVVGWYATEGFLKWLDSKPTHPTRRRTD